MPGTGAELALIALTAALTAGGKTVGLCRAMMDAGDGALGGLTASELSRMRDDGTSARFLARAALNRVCGACKLCGRWAELNPDEDEADERIAITASPPPA